MNMRFYLIEDDAATRRMLERLIYEGQLGEVIGAADCGSEVTLDDIREADIVLIDLLMPGRDGIETTRELREQGYPGRFVMISQVDNKEMVGEAYLAGVETYITKPINRLEVLAVLKRVAEHLTLEQSLDTIRHSLSLLDHRSPATEKRIAVTNMPPTFEAVVLDLLARLGISGEAGASDLVKLLTYWERQGFRELTILKERYQEVLLLDHPELADDPEQ
ncbi:MAG TPA: response regulator, partial [Bacilli bacterium]|nr:response regulator [Bacilli bacterium]